MIKHNIYLMNKNIINIINILIKKNINRYIDILENINMVNNSNNWKIVINNIII